MATLAAPTPATLVAAELLAYLQLRKGMATPSYLQAPTAIPDGWETYTYRFQLLGRKPLPPELKGPLILRVYAGPEGLPRLRREWVWQSRLAGCGYPVARPVWKEEDCDFLGGPFLIMQCVEGDTLFDRLRRDHFALLWGPGQMAAVHARLHQMSLQGTTLPERPFLEGRLEELQAAVDDYSLRGLAPGMAWLHAHQPPPEPSCMVHLDYHPRNILVRDGRCAAVLDWSEADIGDRHADVAIALFIIDAVSVEELSLWDRLVMPIGRWLTHRRYLRAYRRLLPVDPIRLHYYQAWAALRRLTWYGQWLAEGARVMGFKPGAEGRLRAAHVADVERYFERYSGVRIRLGLALRSAAGRPALATG